MKEAGSDVNRVVIVGAGPRGLCVFERITKIYEESGMREGLEVVWIDPGENGQGVHSSRQPQHMLSNTIAGHISIFPGDTVVGGGPARSGWSLLEWANAQGYRNIDGCYHKAPSAVGSPVGEEDYVPRGILGEYLTWAYGHLVDNLPAGLSVRHYKNTAVDIIRIQDDLLEVVLDSGYFLHVNYVFLTTGHGQNMPDEDDHRFSEFVVENSVHNPYLRYFRNPYPVEQLKLISQDATVAIQGLGLCAHDVIAELTVGRGGTFVRDPHGLRYLPSGREPRIVVFSRSGLPYIGREKGVDAHYEPQFFTRTAIDELRRRALQERASKQLDFEVELWPLLVQEMCFVYHLAEVQVRPHQGDSSSCPECRRAVMGLLYPLRAARFGSLSDFTATVKAYLKWDIQQVALEGCVRPCQAATDLLRDMRRVLRYAIDFSGLTPESHRQVMEEYWPLLSRLSAGPPKHRNTELLALLEAGIVAWAGGPYATVYEDSSQWTFVVESAFQGRTERTCSDVFIKARIDSFYPERDASSLVKSLLRSGMITPYLNGDYHPGGIAITENHNPVTVSGKVVKNIWALGNIVEGPNFFTHILPQTVSSGVIRDAGKCVLEMFASIASRECWTGGLAYSKSR